jgi:hypothetical protein
MGRDEAYVTSTRGTVTVLPKEFFTLCGTIGRQ